MTADNRLATLTDIIRTSRRLESPVVTIPTSDLQWLLEIADLAEQVATGTRDTREHATHQLQDIFR